MKIRAKTSEENFRDVNAELGTKFVECMISRSKDYKEAEEVLFWLGGAWDNLETFDNEETSSRGGDLEIVRDSMEALMDDAGSVFTYIGE